MTRATDRPLRRVVRDGRDREYVVELRALTLTIRPIRSRTGGPSDLSIPWAALYARLFPAPKRRRIGRGLLR